MAAPLLAEQVAQVPDEPGVYLWRASDGAVLYVGKAKALRRRMRSYLAGHDERPMVPRMMSEVASFDYYVTRSEVDSLILEAELIKRHRPPYNVDYRDDKTYPFIALTLSDPFPAIKYTRERHRTGTRYFGPYADAKAARATIDTVRRVFPICRADCVEWKRLTARGGEPAGKPCFDHHVGKGPGPCVGAITREEYARTVRAVADFLDGRRGGVVTDLEREMKRAAAELDFERAAASRNRLEAVRSVLDRQTVVTSSRLDADVVGLCREETIAAAHVFRIREGRVIEGAEQILGSGLDVGGDELVEGFLLRYYGQASHVPREVVLASRPAGAEALEGWLGTLRGSKVALVVPARGEKRRLLELATTNATYALARYRHRTRYDEGLINEALLQLENALGLPAPPLRIEAFDISTLHGSFSVGSMVVFTGGRPDPRAYRRFRIRIQAGESNDVAMMREVLERRFLHEAREGSRFATRPDLLVVDGGKPQLSAALRALDEIGAADLPVAALAKRQEELYLPGWVEPVVLPAGSPSLHLVKRVRDEAHRFAVAYHRDLRGKAMTASILDDIPGVGPTRKKALLQEFGSVRRLRAATIEQIAAVKGITSQVAADVLDTLRASEGPPLAG